MQPEKYILFLIFVKFSYGTDAFIHEKSDLLLCEALRDFSVLVNEQVKIKTINFITNKNNSLESKGLMKTLECLVSDNLFAITLSNPLTKTSSLFISKGKESQNVIILDSKKDLKTILGNMTNIDYNNHEYYLIVISGNTTNDSDMDSMFELLWQYFIYNVNILVHDHRRAQGYHSSMKIFTFFPFSAERKCHDTKSVKINEFKDNKWSSDLAYPPKLESFYNCQVKAVCQEFGVTGIRTVHQNGSVSLSGIDVEILRSVTKALNIELDLQMQEYKEARGQIFNNGTSTGAFNQIITGKVAIAANFNYLTEHRSKFMQFSQSYDSVSMILIIPRGALYTPLETLFRAFKLCAWVILCTFMLAVFIIIAIIKLQSRRVQILFFDRNINSPFMEVLAILFGIAQHALPSKSFSRLLLTSFAIFCFIFRTVYIGSMFKFLQVFHFYAVKNKSTYDLFYILVR